MYSRALPSVPGSGSSSFGGVTVTQERGSNTLQPTFTGHIATTYDALVLFEACLRGHLSLVPRRPHDRERNSLIRSGCIFIYAETESGIKRWTDGVTWSPSRLLGDFLVYRELDKPPLPLLPGEKKRAEKKAKKKDQRRNTRLGEPYPRSKGTGEPYSPTTSQSTSFINAPTPNDAEWQLIGSLVDSYDFKPNGLVKKTMSVVVQGVTHHLVSYYNMDDIKEGLLPQPSQASGLNGIQPRPSLISKQSFRAPLQEVDESTDGAREGGYQPLRQPYYHQNSKSSPNAAYPQRSYQPGVSAGYPVGPPMGVFMPQVPAPQMPPREGPYGEFSRLTYRNYDSLTSSIPPQSHPNIIPPTPFFSQTNPREAVRDILSWPCTRMLHAMRPENKLKDLPSRSTSGPNHPHQRESLTLLE